MMNRRARHVQPREVAGCKLAVIGYKITGLSDADPVTTWSDQSGNGNDAAQSTSGNKPTYQTGEINGHPAVLFDGDNDYLQCSNGLISGTDGSIFCVAKQNALSGYVVNLAGLVTKYHTSSENSFTFRFRGTSLELAGGDSLVGGTLSVGDWGVLVLTFSASSATGYIDGTQEFTGNPGLSTGSSNVTLGVDFLLDARYLDGLMAEALVYDSAISASLRQRLEGRAALLYAIRQN